MSKLFCVLGAVAAVLACIACAHDVPVHEGVSILTTSNMSLASTGDWLLVLYAPWCPHCRTLLDNLPELADKLKDSGVTIGVINADAEPSVQMQFSLHGFPSIFMAHDGEVYGFPTKVGRNVENLAAFATKDYSKETPITGFKAPFGIVMRAFALYSSFAISSYRFLEVYAKKLDIPPMWFFCGVAVVLALFVIVLMIILSRCRQPKKCPAPRKNKKEKEDPKAAAIVEQARAEKPTEGANSEEVKEKVEKAKKDEKLRRRAVKQEEEGRREEQQAAQKKNKKMGKSKSQQNRPIQQAQKRQ